MSRDMLGSAVDDLRRRSSLPGGPVRAQCRYILLSWSGAVAMLL